MGKISIECGHILVTVNLSGDSKKVAFGGANLREKAESKEGVYLMSILSK